MAGVSNSWDKHTILIIDDDKLVRSLFVRKLTQEGFAVIEAIDGASGIELALERRPDLIILDIRMPEMTGYQMLKKLRGMGEWGEHVPVIFLSALEPTKDSEMADIEATEPAFYFVKGSTNLDTLVLKINEVLGVKK